MASYIKRFFISLLLIINFTGCLDTDEINGQLNKEVLAIDKYLTTNVTDYIAYDASGIRLVIHQFGQLPPADTTQTVKATIVGKLFPALTIFDEQTITTKLEDISVDGLRFGISALMNGSTASIYVPSQYAFGSNGTSLVPGNTSVVYEVTITEVIRTATQQAKFEADTTAIRSFVEQNEVLNVVAHPSGVFYTITTVGAGLQPKVYDAVNFTYTGKLLSNNTTFDDGALSTSIFALIDGLKVGMPLLKKDGGKATFYIPSGLGYGPKGSGPTIPGNSNLIFEVELN
jgi:FKBP-type peptidyl-prolyl cis-trans isomerase